MVKILHCADLHIDTLFSSYSVREAISRKKQIFSAFSKAVEKARIEKTKIFIIAGDMFDDCGAVSYETLSDVSREIASLPDCKFIIACGNHDPYVPGGIFDSALWPANAYIFKSDKVEKFSFDELNTDVYGYSFTSKALRECPLENFSVENKDRINIVVAHGDTEDALSNYCPIRKKLLEGLDADYIALGHIHKGNNEYNGEKYAYSGCIIGRALDEAGQKGFLIGEVGKGKRNLKFYSPDPATFEIKELDVSSCATAPQLKKAIENTVQSFNKETCLRLILKGELSSLIESIPQVETEISRLEIVDQTVLQINAEELSTDMGLKGAIYARLKKTFESDDVEERNKGKVALKYIMSALNGTNIFE